LTSEAEQQYFKSSCSEAALQRLNNSTSEALVQTLSSGALFTSGAEPQSLINILIIYSSSL